MRSAFTAGLFWAFALALAPRSAQAFPEMIRYGYVNCTSCHVSPSGGGNLNAYGRAASNEILSTWGAEHEEAFAYNLVPLPSWIDAQGLVRGTEVHQSTPTQTNSRLIFMQGDLEAAFHYERFTFDGTVGYANLGNETSDLDHLIDRRFYLLGQVNDQLSVRAGKFLPAFGINEPDHIISTRRSLQINDEGTETYNAEVAWLGETYNLYVTGILGRPDESQYNLDQGFTVTGSRAFGDGYKAGVSYYHGSNSFRRREVTGGWGVLGFTKQLFLLSEVDFQYAVPASPIWQNTWGMAEFSRLGYEVYKGVVPYLQGEVSRLDFRTSASLVEAYSLGLQFFPRPHFQLEFEWQRQRYAIASQDFGNYVFLMGNFYL